LVDLHVPSDGLHTSDSHYKVEASFCEIDWELHKEDPAKVSFFAGLKEQSKSCAATMRTFDLHDIVQRVRSHDDAPDSSMRSIPPKGVIFHESRCGSTLAANILASFAPHKTRIYSEHVVPIKALKACSNHRKDSTITHRNSCNHELHMQLIRDVYYILGRASLDSEMEHVFYKTNSGGMYIDKFTSAFPDTPWAYMFRDTHEIMQSHWKVAEESADMSQLEDVKCSRLYRNPNQPPTTQAVLDRASKEYHELTRTEYCAAHLASISLAVMQEHQRTGKGRFINYNQMPAVMWQTLLPIDFGIEVDSAMIDNMMQLTHVYSKGHQQGRANEKWVSDADHKKKSITQNVTRAVEMLSPDTYAQLERISQKQQREPETWMLLGKRKN